MTTYLFPGQGSQSKGMGAQLFDLYPDLVDLTDATLGYSIRKLCLENEEDLGKTQFTQPALYVVNALTYFQKIQDAPIPPTFLVGHSLGEYNALLAASVFDFETGLKLVKKRAELMSQMQEGAMAAVIGLSPLDITQILFDNELSLVSIANYNSHSQTVITGDRKQIAIATTLLSNTKAKLVIPLKVNGAFHSPLMQEAQKQFAEFVNSFTFSAPHIPVISNVTASPYEKKQIAAYLAEQITHPVRFTESIDYLISQGETEFEEVGPGNVLTGLVRRIKAGQ